MAGKRRTAAKLARMEASDTFVARTRASTRGGPAGLVPRLAGVRWDRVARVALLVVLVAILILYIGPARSYWTTWNESKAKQAEVAELEKENKRLKQRAAALRDPATVEEEARKLGMVAPDERAYSVTGIKQR
jgi:cell division protein FtsB